MKFLLSALGCCVLLTGCASIDRSEKEPASCENREVKSAMTEPPSSVPAPPERPVLPAPPERPELPAPPEPVLFTPTYRGNPERQYAEARKIYASSPAVTQQGVYEHDSLVFVIVVIDTNREKLRYLEGTAMLRAADLLRKNYPELPANLRLRHRLVEKSLDDDTGLYRYALVYRLADLEKAMTAGDGN